MHHDICESGLLRSIEQQAPKLWAAFTAAADEGLIFIDEANDAITASNRLLLTFPDLHDMISHIVDHWTRHRPEAGIEHLTELLIRTGVEQ